MLQNWPLFPSRGRKILSLVPKPRLDLDMDSGNEEEDPSDKIVAAADDFHAEIGDLVTDIIDVVDPNFVSCFWIYALLWIYWSIDGSWFSYETMMRKNIVIKIIKIVSQNSQFETVFPYDLGIFFFFSISSSFVYFDWYKSVETVSKFIQIIQLKKDVPNVVFTLIFWVISDWQLSKLITPTGQGVPEYTVAEFHEILIPIFFVRHFSFIWT